MPFKMLVNDPRYSEKWVEGVDVFHNPNANIPLDESFLIGASHHFFENGNVRSLIPRFHPYQSETLILSPKRAPGALRLGGGQSLGIGGETWYEEVEKHPEISHVHLSRQDRLDHFPDLIDELVQAVSVEASTSNEAYSSARMHGGQRREHGYTLGMLLEETSILHHVVSDFAQKNLLTIDLSRVLPDLVQVDDRLQRMLRYSLETFFGMKKEREDAA